MKIDKINIYSDYSFKSNKKEQENVSDISILNTTDKNNETSNTESMVSALQGIITVNPVIKNEEDAMSTFGILPEDLNENTAGYNNDNNDEMPEIDIFENFPSDKELENNNDKPININAAIVPEQINNENSSIENIDIGNNIQKIGKESNFVKSLLQIFFN